MPKPLSQHELDALVHEMISHREALLRWLENRFPDAGDSEDLVQESILRVIQYAKSRPIRSVRAFLFSTARNLALNKIRHTKIENRADADLDLLLQYVAIEQPDPFQQVRKAEEVSILKEAISTLPKRCRMIFTMRKFEELSHQEIANRLGLSKFTVQNQGLIGMQKCRQHFLRSEQAQLALS